MLLSNVFSNKLDNLIDSNNKKNVINHCPNRNATNSKHLAIENIRVDA